METLRTGSSGIVCNVGWTDAAREAALEARQAHSEGEHRAAAEYHQGMADDRSISAFARKRHTEAAEAHDTAADAHAMAHPNNSKTVASYKRSVDEADAQSRVAAFHTKMAFMASETDADAKRRNGR